MGKARSFVDDASVYSEEKVNLARIEHEIDSLYQEEYQGYISCKEDLGSFRVYDREDRERYVDLWEEVEKHRARAEEYRSFMPSPYFLRLDVDSDVMGLKTFFVGKKGLTDCGRPIITDWRSPFVMAARSTKKQNFEVNGCDYDLYVRREIEIVDAKIKMINTEFQSDTFDGNVIDPFLLSVLRDKRRNYRLTDIIKTIQQNQNEIIGKPIEESFIVQGCAGSGKTMILLHRLSYLLYNYSNYRADKYCILTPNEYFDLHIDDLSKELEIDKVKRFTVEGYYQELIARLSGGDYDFKETGGREAKLKLPKSKLRSEKGLDEKLLSELYSDAYYCTLEKLYEQIWCKFAEELETVSFEKMAPISAAEITPDYPHTFETYKKLKEYHAKLVVNVERSKKEEAQAKENIARSQQTLKECEAKQKEIGEILPLLRSQISEKLHQKLAEDKEKIALLKHEEEMLSARQKELQYQRDELAKSICAPFTQREIPMPREELVSLAYVQSADTPFCAYVQKKCVAELENIARLQLALQKVPFYNFGRKTALKKELDLVTKAYQEKALTLLDQYVKEISPETEARQEMLAQAEKALLATAEQLRNTKAAQKQAFAAGVQLDEAVRVVCDEKTATVKQLLQMEALSDVRADLKKFDTLLKSVVSGQNSIIAQSAKIEESRCTLEKCAAMGIDDSLLAEIDRLKKIIDNVDVKRIYSFFEANLNETYEKHGQKVKKNENCRHKLYVMLCMCALYYGESKHPEKFINVDEAQDLAVTEYRLLRRVLGKDAVFNLYGDVNQLVYSYKGITDWEELGDVISSRLYFLNENYRNTIQITEYCNERFGANVCAIGLNGDDVKRLPLEEAIADMKSYRTRNSHARAAIIYRKGQEALAKQVLDRFLGHGCVLDSVDADSISILTVEAAKGLEFERVLVLDNDMTVNEKYISFTRALEGLVISTG